MQKLSEPVLLDCPKCTQPTLKKLISPVAFRLKGTGWYETDFKNTQKTERPSNQAQDNGRKIDGTSPSEESNPTKSSSDNSGEGAANQSTESNKRAQEPNT